MKFKPLVDKLYWILFIPTNVVVVLLTVIPPFFAPQTLLVTLPILLFLNYFFISPLFGYVELREEDVLIKYGLIIKRIIPYSKIRSAEKKRRFYSDSILSLKNSFEHVDIKYNSFDVTAVSVRDNDKFIDELEKRRKG
ncbi:MAG: PH domain-containing protein [Clostridia bacterium]|nr:PH domain-containing protein [Clostridia bacterium]